MLRRVSKDVFEAPAGEQVRIVCQALGNNAVNAARFQYDSATLPPTTIAGLPGCSFVVGPSVRPFTATVTFDPNAAADARYDLFEVDTSGSLRDLGASIRKADSVGLVSFAINGVPSSGAIARGGLTLPGQKGRVEIPSQDVTEKRTGASKPPPSSQVGGSAVKKPRPRQAPSGKPRGKQSDEVRCSVFAPARAAPGAIFMVQVFAHLAGQEEAVKRMATEFDEATAQRGAKTLDQKVTRGSELTFLLSLSAWEVVDPIQALTWQARSEAVQFSVRVPEAAPVQDVIGTVHISQGSVPFGHVKFVIRTLNRVGEPEGDHDRSFATTAWKRYRHAFVSYASADRPEVLKRVQMLPRLSISFFQDLLSLEPGERWEKQLYKEIDNSDVFFLFWSTAAKNSEWVLKEVRYALARKGHDELAPPEIMPIIIEGPPPVLPPPELAHLHFNDTFMYFINAGR